MGRPCDYIHDEKAEVIFHLKRGAIIILFAEIIRLFGSQYGTVLQERLETKIYVSEVDSERIRLNI
jgi:hypothetical protein